MIAKIKEGLPELLLFAISMCLMTIIIVVFGIKGFSCPTSSIATPSQELTFRVVSPEGKVLFIVDRVNWPYARIIAPKAIGGLVNGQIVRLGSTVTLIEAISPTLCDSQERCGKVMVEARGRKGGSTDGN